MLNSPSEVSLVWRPSVNPSLRGQCYLPTFQYLVWYQGYTCQFWRGRGYKQAKIGLAYTFMTALKILWTIVNKNLFLRKIFENVEKNWSEVVKNQPAQFSRKRAETLSKE